MMATRRGWFHLASGAGLGRVFGFASNLLLSRWLGPTELGLFNLVTTTVQTSDTLVRCGADYALNFELGGQPDAISTQRGSNLARALVQICTLTTLLICLAIAFWITWGEGLFPISFAGKQRLVLSGLLLVMIACEGASASAWEVLLACHRTASVALKQGLFFPLRLFFAAAGGLFGGVAGSMCGWNLVALVQLLWLRTTLGQIWNPFQIWPPLGSSIYQLLSRGFPFFFSNLLSSILFYPLLLKVAADSGLTDIGYLRAGQILQQLFAFLPATLVPVLFLRLRSENTFRGQVLVMEKPLRIIWLVLLEVLLLFFMVDRHLISLLFGTSFAAALMPTRLLLVTALFECLAQLIVQPLLASGQTRLYGYWQNGAAVFSASMGMLWIPTAGLAAYLIVRLVYVIIPLIGFGANIVHYLCNPQKIYALSLVTISLLTWLVLQILTDGYFVWSEAFLALTFVVLAVVNYKDILLLRQMFGVRG